ncbi:MAG: MFS transporter [Acidimicrobiales bacterium]
MTARSGIIARRLGAAGLSTAAVIVPLTTIVSHSFARSSYPLLLPAIKDDMVLSNTQAGVGGTAIFAAYLTGVIVVTLVSGAVEPVTILRSGLAVSGLGLVLIALSPSFPFLLLGLVLSSSGGAGIWITAPLLATEGVAADRRGIVIGLLTGTIGLGTSAVALGTRLARTSTGNADLWRPIYTVEAVVTVAVLLIVLGGVRARVTARTPGGRISLVGLRTVPGWKAITIAYVMFGAIASGYTSFLAEALEEDGGLSRSAVANIYIGLGITSLFGAPLMGWISDRAGRRRALMAVMIMIMMVSTTVALVTGPLLALTVLTVGGMWASYPTLTATYMRDHLEDRTFGAAYGTMTIFYAMAAVPPPFLVGAIADWRGSFTASYLLVTALAVAGLLALRGLPRESAT